MILSFTGYDVESPSTYPFGSITLGLSPSKPSDCIAVKFYIFQTVTKLIYAFGTEGFDWSAKTQSLTRCPLISPPVPYFTVSTIVWFLKVLDFSPSNVFLG